MASLATILAAMLGLSVKVLPSLSVPLRGQLPGAWDMGAGDDWAKAGAAGCHDKAKRREGDACVARSDAHEPFLLLEGVRAGLWACSEPPVAGQYRFGDGPLSTLLESIPVQAAGLGGRHDGRGAKRVGRTIVSGSSSPVRRRSSSSAALLPRPTVSRPMDAMGGW